MRPLAEHRRSMPREIEASSHIPSFNGEKIGDVTAATVKLWLLLSGLL